MGKIETYAEDGSLSGDELLLGSDADTGNVTKNYKLSTVKTYLEGNLSAAAIKTLYESNANTNAFTDADHSKLDGIEASADVTDETNVVAALDGATLTAITVAGTDKVLLQDADDSDNLKTATVQAIADLAAAASEVNDLTAAVTWANIPDANVPVSAVTQHEAALSIINANLTDDDIKPVKLSRTNATLGAGEDGYVLRFDNATSDVTWGAEVNTFATIQVDGVTVSTGPPTLDFAGSDFTLAESPTDDFDITIRPERIKNLVGEMVTGNTETGIAVAFESGDKTLDFVVTETNDLTAAVTWADVPDANITSSSVEQHLTDIGVDVTVDATGSTEGSPAVLGLSNMNSGTETGRFSFGDVYNTIESSYNAGMAIHSYNTGHIWMGRETLSALTASTHYANIADVALMIHVAQADEAVVIRTEQASPSVDFFQLRNSSDTAVFSVDETGAVTLSSTVAGRDITTDGTKLDGIESGADVTDEANVTAALDGATLTDIGTPASTDRVLIQDADDSNNLKYADFSEFGGGGASQLTDLSDVNTAGVTNRNVLVADGVDFESRALVEADISDLGSYITASSTDTLTNKTFDADGTGNVLTNIGSSEIKSEMITGMATVTATDGDFILISDTGDSGNLKKVDVRDLKTHYVAIPFSDADTNVAVATKRGLIECPITGIILDAYGYIDTAPTGADMILDVNKNGTTIMTTDKVDIAAGDNSSRDNVTQPAITTTAVTAGDVLSVDVDQVGSTVAGKGFGHVILKIVET